MRELRLKVPKSYIELSGKQLKTIARLKALCESEEQFLTLAFLHLSGLKVVKTKKHFAYQDQQVHYYRHHFFKKPFIIESFVFQELIKSVEWLLNDAECKPLKWIGWNEAYHYRMYNATFEAYLMAENYYQAFCITKNTDFLNRLVATIYWRLWESFNADNITQNSTRFKKVPFATKYTVFMWYAGFRQYVLSECPTLFKPGGGGKPVKVKEQINSMMRMLNKGRIVDNPDILKAKVWDALYEMEAMAKEVENLK